MLSSHILAGLLALAPAVLASPVAFSTNRTIVTNALKKRGTAGRQSFWNSCEDCKLLGGAVLGCLCTQDDGVHVKYSHLNLNQCIGVDEKHNLIWKPNGQFTSKCDKIGADLNKLELTYGMSLPQLRASCNKESYRPDAFGAAFINLDEGIHVESGNLVCDGSK